ncbi:NAD(P)-dependent dehydrogenase (short-subunit alcohol dehydrogenase family) [Nocardioides zeae]|uniref:NAD(P)-dependent dehydrogenase (Short-subunit alcohol dehydrogenase family) n=1 Tax=Nocardioides zeae TaxID=1457234 RepID=A0ACC6IM83_9ACTN|nr:SDR family oxidoreductase [Nocardioides zeae]MDR6175951.1 NAD(P)-dependent dehydrogenase (short-subunit alcohol dehydrogenase family) [Nocardioides zeae]MDR6211752.1 NAD(P)-dependent dehydrogenase (short-subunit alcohol dehydrogenase family) [Nocardioides zeae]
MADALPETFPAQRQDPPGLTAAMDPVPDHGEDTYVGHGRLEGRVALITGGDSGIGRAVALAYAREGADVAFTHLPEEQPDADETARLVTEAGRRVLPLAVDLRDSETCRSVVERTVEELARLDVLVNNAGYQMARGGGIATLDDDDLDRTLKTNLYALFWTVRAAVPHLRASRGCIINNTSIQAYEPSTSLVDYAATKAAINNATVNLAAELGPDGIRVNAVAPGPIWTPLQPATQPAEKIEQFGSDTPLGRAGQPAEVAPAFVFLASPRDASYVSGTVLGVTGGKPVF